MTLVVRIFAVFVAIFSFAKTAAAETPLDYLNQADTLLKAVSRDSLKKDGLKKMDELNRNFAQLVAAYRKAGESAVPAAASSDTDADGDSTDKPANWKAHFSQVERDLASLIGGVPPLAPQETQQQLEQVRLAVELFFSSVTLNLETEGTSPQPAPQPSTQPAPAPSS